MKDIILYTKKIRLNFNASGVSVLSIQELIEEVEKEYKIMDPNPSVAIFEEFQLVTFKVLKKTDAAKKPLGFSFTN